MVFFFKQKTAYEIPKRDWSSDVCSSDLEIGSMRGEIDETVFELTKLQNEDIWNIIESFQLNTKSRREDVAYKRYYLYSFMYNHRHMTFSMIGKFFNRDHSSVIHGMREHQYWYSKKDSRYLKYIHPLPDLIKAKREDIRYL